MQTLEKLRSINPGFRLFDREDPAFAPYGEAIHADWTGLVAAMDATVPIPAEGVAYVPSHPPLEATDDAQRVAELVCGGLPVQVGYCSGRNSTLNGLEYHKSSEVIVAGDDLVLLLGLRGDIERGSPDGERAPSYDSSKIVGLVLLRGQAVELFTGTLHLAPCRAHEGGFRSAIVLAKGTNVDFAPGERPEGDVLLRKRNKWIMAHPERKVLVDQGVLPAITGPNRAIRPIGEGL